MSSVDWSSELAAALERVIPPGDGSRADWGDVLTRVGKRRERRIGRRLPSRPVRLAVAVALVFLLLAGVATATYFALRSSPSGLIYPRTQESSFAVLDAQGHAHDLWRCPRRWFCDEVGGAALSPDGKRLVVAFDALTLARPNIGGMYVIDLATGTDHQVPPLRVRNETAAASMRSQIRRQRQTFGCFDPKYFAWSPDGSQLAYSCEELRAFIYTIRPDGTGRRLVPTHTRNAYAPSWSPDGKQVAFSTCRFPFVDRSAGLGGRPCRSVVYVVDLDGRHERRLAAGAFPDWSPDGGKIAYAAPGCGSTARGWRIRLVTPGGRDVTPQSGDCGGIGPPDSVVPAWSPDDSRIAVTTLKALYVMNADGSGLERILRGNFLGRGVGGLLRPFWQPLTKGKQ